MSGGERNDETVVPVTAARRVAGRVVEEHRVDAAVRVRADRRRRGDASVQVDLPRGLPRLLADRGETPGVGREVQALVADRRRELDEAARVVFPDGPERRLQREVDRACSRRAESVGRPLHLRRNGRRLLLRRDERELGRRGAAHVLGLPNALDHERGEDAADEQGEHCKGDEEAPHGGVRVALACASTADCRWRRIEWCRQASNPKESRSGRR